MTRTILLAATAVAALATSSVMVTDADARGGGGFASHQSRPASRPVAARPVSHFRPAARPVSHSIAHPTFSQAHHHVSQPHQKQASLTRSHVGQGHQKFTQTHGTPNLASNRVHQVSGQAHPSQTRPATAQQKTAVLKAANADQKQANADIKKASQLTGAASALQAKAKLDAAKGNKTLEASDIGRANADLKQAHRLRTQSERLMKSSTAEQAVVGNKRPTQAQIQQVRKTANADINKANELSGAANALQAKAKVDGAKGNKTLAASDIGRANADLKQAEQLRNDAKAEKAAVRGQR